MGEVHNIRNITQEAGIAVAYGLDKEKALSALTLNVAKAYGMDDDYGSLAKGKVANLVIWPGDPFELSSMPEQVYIRGKAIPMVSRQTLLRDRYLDLSTYAP
jgi:imidazolonepropionase-like amidohydrolase